MIPESIKKEILTRIRNAEAEHNVKVLYAVESGSRAWGFASKNSDYDVRFIYAHPREWYLTIDLEDKRDVIEYKIVDEIDINGWDLRKSLKLFWNSNPAIIEWLHSPIVYVDNGLYRPQLVQCENKLYSINKGIYHYRSMAKNNYRGYLQSEIVPLKKYFYVLRPLLSILWLEKYQKPAPIEFEKLKSMISNQPNLFHEVQNLLERKMKSTEKEMGKKVPIISGFIESELNRLEQLELFESKTKREISVLNNIFNQNLG